MITYQLLVFAWGRILKEIANNFSELNNEVKYFSWHNFAKLAMSIYYKISNHTIPRNINN